MAISTLLYKGIAHSGELHGDPKNIISGGLFYSAGDVTDPPTGVVSAGHVILITNDSGTYRKMLYSPYNANTLYMRTYLNNSWTEWVKIGG